MRPGKRVDLARLQRHFYAASSCGVCGKASIGAVRVGGIHRPRADVRVGPALLVRLPGELREAQAVFERTGGLHAAALFDLDGGLVDVREDVGRHNTVDKIIGHALLDGMLPLSEHVLLVSGRGAFEIVQKALVAGLPSWRRSRPPRAWPSTWRASTASRSSAFCAASASSSIRVVSG